MKGALCRHWKPLPCDVCKKRCTFREQHGLTRWTLVPLRVLQVIIQATLGPMPDDPKLVKKAPAQIPNPYPTLPPPAYPPPPAMQGPPPPKVTGPLAQIFTSKEAANYSVVWSLLQPLAFQLEQTVKSFTILAPRDDAIAQYMDAIDVQLSLLPDQESQSAFLSSLLQFHVIPDFADAAAMEVTFRPPSLVWWLPGIEVHFRCTRDHQGWFQVHMLLICPAWTCPKDSSRPACQKLRSSGCTPPGPMMSV